MEVAAETSFSTYLVRVCERVFATEGITVISDYSRQHCHLIGRLLTNVEDSISFSSHFFIHHNFFIHPFHKICNFAVDKGLRRSIQRKYQMTHFRSVFFSFIRRLLFRMFYKSTTINSINVYESFSDVFFRMFF